MAFKVSNKGRGKSKKIPMYRIRRLNEEAGQFWFSPKTLKFFKSKIPDEAVKKGDSAYFISRETNPSGETAFTIRKANLKSGDIDTEGEFFKYKSRDEAQKELNKILNKSGI